MQPNTTTENNTQRIQKILDNSYDEDKQVLGLCTLYVDSVNNKDDWRSVLEFRNWTALRSLDLSSTAITQGIVTSTTLVLNLSAVCSGPTSNNYIWVHFI